MKLSLPALLVVALCAAPLLHAEAVKDREGAVRSDRTAMESNDRWIYNDVDAGFTAAQKSGKPLLVVLRCVPCKACMGIDASILKSAELQPLLDQFVCVRVINANALDLTLFQFDYDLSFSTLFFNADHTVYGRYGSWQHQRDANDATTAGYKAALEAALAVHRTYPANKSALAAKQGGPAPFKTPVEIPALAGKYERELNWKGNVVQSCVHCHQIGDAFRAWHRSQGTPIPPELIYPMPAPETIGLTLNPERCATVKEVTPDSLAAQAGLHPGDDLLAANGAPLLSIADFAWALHRSPEEGDLRLLARRAGAAQEITVHLPAHWRWKTDISTRVGTWPMRAMATGGLKLEPLPPEKRTALGLAPGTLALQVARVGEYGPHGAAKKAGFQKDDILIEAGGLTSDLTESEFLGRLLTAHPQKSDVKAIVLRGQQRVELMLPMQ
ncbi:MAG: Trx7/PDZ domain-containing (seleno)protein [Chthoniobacter sp.]|uniref:Trx7/PDZ domain-containing (seleno)protein n=1 Tax=Chthoniobacter sp. TaxID=2510640 RepID=UPI0032A3EA1D